MATKINTDYYGAEADFYSLSNYLKRSPFNLYNLFDNGTYTGGALDVSAAPWGIGKSSASSDMEFIAAKGAEWTIHRIEQSRGNTPLYFYQNSSNTMGAHSTADFIGYDATESNYQKALYKSRIAPEAHNSGYDVISDLAADSGDSVTLASVLYNYPITYADYQGLRVYIHHVYYKPEGEQTIKLCSMSDILNNNVSVDKIVYFDFEIYNKAGSISAVYCSIGGNALQTPELFKAAYYGDNETYVRPWRYIDRFGDWYIPSFDSSIGFRNANSSASSDQGDWEDGDPNISPEGTFNGWTHASTASQTFGELSYHWEYGISPYSSDQWDIDPVETGTTYASGVYRMYCYMEFDDEPDDKNEAYFEAILHEVAFLGLPIIISLSDLYEEIGSDNVYLPVFDSHMITTGEYMSGTDSLNLDNAAWGDIFSDTMPAYDPEYEPEPPEPDEGDSGNLENASLSGTYFRGSNRYYLVNEANLKQFIGAVNGLYVNDGNDTQMKLDFKGSNPNDYIVGVYGIPIDLVAATVGDTIHLGPVDTTISAATLDPTWQHTINFGEYAIPAKYGNFRDYEPYTSIELYIPLCGTVKLDCAEYIGHTVKVDGVFDLQTGELTCRVIRKSSLGDMVTHTLNGSIWVEIPISARDMGTFQNNQHQIKMALIQTGWNQIQRTFGRASTDISSATSAIQSRGKSGLNFNGLNAFTVGGDVINTALDTYNLKYQLSHMAAPISTTSTASTANGVMMYNRAKIFIKRAKKLPSYKPAQYSHIVGNACCKTGKLSEFSGYTQAATAILDNVHTKHTSRQATEQEKQLLRKALQNGIYL